MDELILFVNGKKVSVKNPDPETTLLQFLRNDLQLKGTKLGCGEGGCGACTVMVTQFDHKESNYKYFIVKVIRRRTSSSDITRVSGAWGKMYRWCPQHGKIPDKPEKGRHPQCRRKSAPQVLKKPAPSI